MGPVEFLGFAEFRSMTALGKRALELGGKHGKLSLA